MEKKLTSFDLKVIACISMFIDHFGAILVYQLIMRSEIDYLNSIYSWVLQNRSLMIGIYNNLRIIGRIAFPIYCFLLVEGFCHTKNVFKYMFRLFLFALISEVAFDIGFNQTIFEIYSNNVFFTLFLGLCLIFIISKVENVYKVFKDKNKVLFTSGCLLLVLGFVLLFGELAENYFRSDYGFSGVLCIVMIYLFRNNHFLGYSLGVLGTVFLNNSTIQLYGLFGLFFILMYNGEKGKSMKYLFYLFYPLHILLITGITYLLG